MEKSSDVRIIQPNDLFKMLNLKNSEEAEYILTQVFNFLLYIRPGDVIETSNALFEKVSKDLIYTNAKVNSPAVLKSFEEKLNLKFPV